VKAARRSTCEAVEEGRRLKTAAAAALAAHLDALQAGDEELAAATKARFVEASEKLKAAGASVAADAFAEGRIPGAPHLEGLT
jgi:hypothetical protein